jgi:hypothetical protein
VNGSAEVFNATSATVDSVTVVDETDGHSSSVQVNLRVRAAVIRRVVGECVDAGDVSNGTLRAWAVQAWALAPNAAEASEAVFVEGNVVWSVTVSVMPVGWPEATAKLPARVQAADPVRKTA